MNRQIAVLTLAAAFLIVSSTVFAAGVSPVMLDYDAEAYAYAYTDFLYPTSDTDQSFSHNNKAGAAAHACSGEEIELGRVWHFHCSDTSVVINGVYDFSGAELTSHIWGSGLYEFHNYYDVSYTPGGGNGYGYTSLAGTIEIGIFQGCPEGSSGLALQVDAKVAGDASSAWNSWDWWFKVWDDDPNNPLVLLNDSNTSASLDVLAGEVLNTEFYHEASSACWPEAGLESTVKIDFDLFYSVADLDNNRTVDLIDFAILAGDWLKCGDPCDPNVLAGDIIIDDCVDIDDLKVLSDNWLNCYVMLASNPSPADGAGGADPNVVLSWTRGEYVVLHDVYFSTDVNAVANADHWSAEFMGTVSDANFDDPCALELDTRYYWRIDEIGKRCMTEGDVWRFTTWAVDPRLGLVGWWTFDEGDGNTAYDSAGDNDGTIYGATWTTGQIDGALSFDGSGDYVSTGSIDFSGTNKITVSFWVKPNTASTGSNILVEMSSAYNSRADSFIVFFREDETIEATVRGNIGYNAWWTTSTLTPGEWHHVVAVFDKSLSSQESKAYLNGSLDGAIRPGGFDADNTNNFGNQPIYIASRAGSSLYFNGSIDDVHIYDKALSAEEIQQLYQEGLD